MKDLIWLTDVQMARLAAFFSEGAREGGLCDARALLDAIPRASATPDDRGSDADWFREALVERAIAAGIPS